MPFKIVRLQVDLLEDIHWRSESDAQSPVVVFCAKDLGSPSYGAASSMPIQLLGIDAKISWCLIS